MFSHGELKDQYGAVSIYFDSDRMDTFNPANINKKKEKEKIYLGFYLELFLKVMTNLFGNRSVFKKGFF